MCMFPKQTLFISMRPKQIHEAWTCRRKQTALWDPWCVALAGSCRCLVSRYRERRWQTSIRLVARHQASVSGSQTPSFGFWQPLTGSQTPNFVFRQPQTGSQTPSFGFGQPLTGSHDIKIWFPGAFIWLAARQQASVSGSLFGGR